MVILAYCELEPLLAAPAVPSFRLQILCFSYLRHSPQLVQNWETGVEQERVYCALVCIE